MIKFTKNCFWITLLLVMFCISFNLKSDEVEVISIDPYIIEKTLSGTPAPTIPFYPAGITDIKIFHADELAVYIRSFHTERSLQAKISLLVDNKNIEEQALTLPPTKTITAQFKLPFVLSSRHEVKLILNFDKPKDLFEWEKVINFNPREKVEIFDILKFKH